VYLACLITPPLLRRTLQVLVLPFLVFIVTIAVKLDYGKGYGFLLAAIPLITCIGCCLLGAVGVLVLALKDWCTDDDDDVDVAFACGSIASFIGLGCLLAGVVTLALKADGRLDLSWLHASAPALAFVCILVVAGCALAYAALDTSRGEEFEGLWRCRRGFTYVRPRLAAMRRAGNGPVNALASGEP
jgi:hypothetical protein